MSLFRRKKSTSKLKSKEPSPLPRSSSGGFHPSSSSSSPLQANSLHVDDFGRPVDRPAFSTPQPERSFGNGFGVGEDPDVGTSSSPQGEMQLLYGYAPLGTQLEFSITKVEAIVQACAVAIRQRGLDTPLIMSSRALDIKLDSVCSLIRAYLEDPTSWENDLEFAAPLAIGAFLKWALARLVNNQNGRGFVSWDAYKQFKTAEKARGYESKSCTIHLIARMSMSNGRLLASLLSLFSSIAAHSAQNGMPPRRLASLFSPYIFGLADDQTFDVTYEEWQRATDATEHLILAYIRDQQADGPLPTFLEKFILNYPSVLNISYSGEPAKIPTGAKVEEVTRVRRLTRFHSRNLIASAGTWDVPHSASWQLFFNTNNPAASLASSTSSTSSPLPVYSSAYRHLLNIRSNSGLDDDLEDEFDQGRYKTRVDKEWSKFGELGFSDVDEKKLEFDLTESERTIPTAPKQPIDWDTFETSGFAGRELFAPNDLVFQQTLSQRVSTYPSASKTLNDRLRAAEKILPAFPYDTTPHEEPRITIDSLFFEAWADVLVGGGWARDELKESSFALIQWKSRPRVGDVGKIRSPRGSSTTTSAGDPRTEDSWVLVEEFVPREYREALTDPKVKKQPKRISFLRTVRRRTTTSPKPNPSAAVLLSPPPLSSPRGVGISNTSSALSSPRSLRPIDESVFTNEHAQTTKVSLSNPVERNSYALTTYASTSYAPSVISTVAANDGHAALSTLSLSDQNGHFKDRSYSPPPPVPSNEIYGINVQGGQTKSPKRGFLARINTMRNREKSRNGTSGASPSSYGSSFGNEATYPNDAINTPVETRDPVWADSIPNAPPILGAVSPPPPPPKSNDLNPSPPAPYPTYSQGNDDSIRHSTMTTSTNPYGGMEDDPESRRQTYVEEEDEGEVLFRGSKSYENGLSEMAEKPQRRQGEGVAPRPLRKESLPELSERVNTAAPLDNSPSRPPYLSGTSGYSSRVANIVGLYEQRDNSPTKPTS
ncbi:uncharacterized protein JCM6883_006886 [Sporobolomyces salmoneus]|uniref:uncharacterized protein n=1 Tax=Sporobolomyces salmoneus TaxID=183962 RepID=UPI0031790DE2